MDIGRLRCTQTFYSQTLSAHQSPLPCSMVSHRYIFTEVVILPKARPSTVNTHFQCSERVIFFPVIFPLKTARFLPSIPIVCHTPFLLSWISKTNVLGTDNKTMAPKVRGFALTTFPKCEPMRFIFEKFLGSDISAVSVPQGYRLAYVPGKCSWPRL